MSKASGSRAIDNLTPDELVRATRIISERVGFTDDVQSDWLARAQAQNVRTKTSLEACGPDVSKRQKTEWDQAFSKLRYCHTPFNALFLGPFYATFYATFYDPFYATFCATFYDTFYAALYDTFYVVQ
jgi:hypothetical protein